MRARLAVAAALALTIALLPTAASAASSLTLTPAEGASGTWVVVEGTCPVPEGAADAGGLWVDAAALIGGEQLLIVSTFDETDASGAFSLLIQLLDFEGTAPVTGDEVVIEARCSDYNGADVGTVTGTFTVTAEASCPDALPTSTGELTEEATVTFFGPGGGFFGSEGGIERIEAEGLEAGSTASLCLYGDGAIEPDDGTVVSPASVPELGEPVSVVGAAVADGAGAIDLLSFPTFGGEVTYALLGTDAEGEPFVWTTRTTVVFPDLPQTGGGGPEAENSPGTDSINDPGGALPKVGGGDVAGLAAAGAALILLGAVTVVGAVALAGRLRRGLPG
jgi:hypothetical protein